MSVLVLVGTRKGLFLLESDEERQDWSLEGPLLTGWSIFHAVVDPRDGTIHVASNNEVYGATTHRSTDRGETWHARRGARLARGHRARAGEDLAHRARPRGRGRTPLARRRARRALPHRRRRGDLDAGRRHRQARDPRPLVPRRRWDVLPFDRAGSRRAGAHVRRHLGGRRLPHRRRRRHVDAGQPGYRRRLPPRSVPRAGPVRAQAARPSRATRAPVAAEPLRRLSLGRSRRELGAARGKRPSERLRLPARARPPRSRRSIRDPGGGRREPRHLRRAARRVPHRRRRLVLVAPGRRVAAACLGCCHARGLLLGPTRPPGIYLGTQSGSLFVSPDAGETWIEAASQLPPILSVEAAEWR